MFRIAREPDVVDDELEPWTSETLAARFELADALISGAFSDARAPGGRVGRAAGWSASC